MGEEKMSFNDLRETTAIAGALFAATVAQLKDEGYLQAKFLEATFAALEESEALNPKVKVGVSYMDTVLRNEEAADHCE